MKNVVMVLLSLFLTGCGTTAAWKPSLEATASVENKDLSRDAASASFKVSFKIEGR